MFGLYSDFAGLDAAQVVGPGGSDDTPTASTTVLTSQAPSWNGFQWVQQSPNMPLSAAQQAYNASLSQQVGPPAPSGGSVLDFVTGLFKPIQVQPKSATVASSTYNQGVTRSPSSMTKYLPYIAIGGVAIVALLMMSGGSKRK
jgi:hypothetical protein